MLTQADLHAQLHYNLETGVFTRLISKSIRVKVGDVAGTLNNHGYIAICINSKIYAAHRLAWLYVYGEWPKDQIDHINNIQTDNRIINLREANNSQNRHNTRLPKNNTTGYKGVTYHKRQKKFTSHAMVNRKTYHLGYFDSAELASEAYQEFIKNNHGEFYNSQSN